MSSIYDKYEVVVGLETHAQLSTNSKIFAPDATAFGASPNTQVSYITLGHPGVLPVLNEKVVDFAVKMGLATNCKIQKYQYFDRKNYFYADLPKGFQTTQDAKPICYDGFLNVTVGDKTTKIRINRIHLEEDAGKSTHDQDPYFSLIDLNRAGVPLIEIVTEPDFRSSDEAYDYLAQIRQLVQYLGVCDGNMEEGSLRCDANVSVRLKGETRLGQRAEVKNMNSLKNVKLAIDYEAKRQIRLLEKGEKVKLETRSFDADTGTTFSLREKEMANDYRYFPEPDLQPIVLTDEYINEIREAMPALPKQLIEKYMKKLGLSAYDAKVLTDEKAFSDYFNETITHTRHYKAAANWLTVPVKSFLNKNNISISDFAISPKTLAELVELVQSGKVNFSLAAQELFPVLAENPTEKPAILADKLKLITQSDDALINELIDDVMAKFPDKVKAYRKGKKGLAGFFMGQIMRMSKTKLDPKLTNKTLIHKLNKK